jgi:Xaa-Pro aminopeptidase
VNGPNFDLNVYSDRRARFVDGLEGAAAIFAAAPVRTRSGDVVYPYRASNDLLYLSGFDEPGSLLLLRPGDDPAVVLFVRPSDPKKEQWEGKRAGVVGAVDHYGVDAAFSIKELKKRLPKLLRNKRDLYYAIGDNRDLDRSVLSAISTLRSTKGKPNQAPRRIVDPRDRIHALRRVKGAEELALMRKAADITAEAHADIMKRLKPGQMEYEVESILNHAFRMGGAVGSGYPTIVGGGANATVLHYIENREPLREGTLVLIDAGAEYRHYNADITRTFPVGRSFTPVQKLLYEAVLTVEKEAISRIKPGVTVHDMNMWSKRAMTQVMIDMGLLNGDLDALFEEKSYERFYMHNLGHYLGMDVHDVGPYLIEEGVGLPLEPGVAITIEPGIYISADAEGVPDEMRGIGIRIEDDVIVTENGCDVITTAAPKEVDDIEALRREALF